MCTSRSAENEGCSCVLTSKHMEVLKCVFQTILKSGRTPTIKEMQHALKKSDNEIIRIVNELEKNDIILRKKGTQQIVSIYPLSLTPTEHQIILEDGTRLFAMCAVDALGAPIMFHRNAKVVSRCKQCNQGITIDIKNEEIRFMSHPNITICSPKSQVYPAAETCCPLVNFFCSKKHADEWIRQNSKLRTNIKQGLVKKGFPRIKKCWRQYGQTLGFI